LITDSLILTAGTFIIFCRSKDTFIKKAIFFGLKCSVVDCLRLFYFTIRPAANLIWTSQTDLHAFKLIDIDQWFDPFHRFFIQVRSITPLDLFLVLLSMQTLTLSTNLANARSANTLFNSYIN